MEFVELNKTEYEEFEYNHEYGNFYQTLNWANLKEKNGWNYYIVGIKENNKILASALLLKKTVFKKLSIIYSPRGYLIDYSNFKLLKFFNDNIKKYAKKNHAIFVKIDPYVIKEELDINGDVVNSGINNKDYINKLLELGYKPSKEASLQPKYAFALNLKNKTIDEVFNNMEPTTRKMIRKNEKMGIYCRLVGIDELNKFTDVMNDTSVRREFIDRPFSYYKNMVEAFKENIKILVAEINLNDHIKSIEEEIKENEDNIIKKEKEKSENKKINIDKTNNIIKEYNNVIDSLRIRLKRAQDLMKENGEVITLGSIMFILHNKEILSLFGGAYGKYKDFAAAYSTNWYMIKYAIENKYEKYNFYGISNFKDKNDKMYGLYDFKRGFGGQVEEYIGEYNLITSKGWYFVYQVIYNSIYLRIKRIKLKKSSN